MKQTLIKIIIVLLAILGVVFSVAYFIKKDFGGGYGSKNTKLSSSQVAEQKLLVDSGQLVADGKYSEGQKIISDLLAKGPSSARLILVLAGYSLEEADMRHTNTSLAQAEVLLAGIAPSAADNTYYHDLAGMLAYQKGNYDEALNHYAQALKLESRNSTVYLHHADALVKKESYDQAARFYQKALELGGAETQSRAYIGMAKVALIMKDDIAKAEEYLEQGLDKAQYRDTRAKILSLHSMIRVSQNNAEGAKTYAQQAIDASPQSELGYLALARALFAIGEQEQAKKSLNDALQANVYGVSYVLNKGQASQDPFLVFMRGHIKQ
ncbi:MAG: tetratricopeptide repeat protein [Candidatus Moraniibacteriota bacterium]